MRIQEVLAGKASAEVVTIHPETSVRALLSALAQHNIGAIVVSSDGSAVDGIVSERDVVRRMHEDEDLLSRPVSEIMTTDVHTCDPADSLDDLMSLMTQQRIRHVPVCDDSRLVGIVSIGDVVKGRINQLEFERDQLDSYVHSSQT